MADHITWSELFERQVRAAGNSTSVNKAGRRERALSVRITQLSISFYRVRHRSACLSVEQDHAEIISSCYKFWAPNFTSLL